MPGRKSTILYRPSPSVVAVLTLSISAGLLASTVTPGRTAFDGSRTTPAIAPFCAQASAGKKTNDATMATPVKQDFHLRIHPPIGSYASETSGDYYLQSSSAPMFSGSA